MKMSKRPLSVLLCLCLLASTLCAFGLSGRAAEPTGTPYTLIHSFDEIAAGNEIKGWNAAWSQEYTEQSFTDENDKTEGKASTGATVAAEDLTILFNWLQWPEGGEMDLTAYDALSFDLYVSDVSHLSSYDMRFGTGTVDGKTTGQYSAKNLKNGWNHIVMPLSDFGDAGAAYEITRIARYRIGLYFDAPATGVTVKFDSLGAGKAVSSTLHSFDEIAAGNEIKGWNAAWSQEYTEQSFTDESDKTEGKASTGATVAAEDLTILFHWLQWPESGEVDLSQALSLSFDLYVSDVSHVTGYDMRFGTGTVDGKTTGQYPGKDLKAGWNHIVMPLSDFGDAGAAYEIARIARYRIGLYFDAPATGVTVKYDNLTVEHCATADTEVPPQRPTVSAPIHSFDEIAAGNEIKGWDAAWSHEYTERSFTDENDKTEGKASTGATIAAEDLTILFYWLQWPEEGELDLTDAVSLSFDLYVSDVSHLSSYDMRFGTGTVDGKATGQYSAKNLKAGWNHIVMPLSDFGDAGAAYDIARIARYRIGLYFDAPATGVTVKFDGLTVERYDTDEPDDPDDQPGDPYGHGGKEGEQLIGDVWWDFDQRHINTYPKLEYGGEETSPSYDVDTEVKTQGEAANVVTVGKTIRKGQPNTLYMWCHALEMRDLTTYEYLEFDLWLQDASALTKLVVRWGSGGVDGAEAVYIGQGDMGQTPIYKTRWLKDGWNHIIIPLSAFAKVVDSQYIPEAAQKVRIALGFREAAADTEVRFDNLVTSYWGIPKPEEPDQPGEQEDLLESTSADVQVQAETLRLKRLMTVKELFGSLKIADGHTAQLHYGSELIDPASGEQVLRDMKLSILKDGEVVKTYTVRYYAGVEQGDDEPDDAPKDPDGPTDPEQPNDPVKTGVTTCAAAAGVLALAGGAAAVLLRRKKTER